MKISQSQKSKQSTTEDRFFQVALSMLPLVGGTTARQLINYCGSAEAVFSTPSRRLAKIPGVGPKVMEGIKKSSLVLQKAEKEIQRCADAGISILPYNDAQYPERLRHIYDAPILLYYQGQADLNHHRIISLVGTRQATAYGREVVERIVCDLQMYQPIIVSGLAYGIDICAHRSAIKHNLLTIGVMGSGMNVIYPAVHRQDAEVMKEKGGLLTENPLDIRPDARKFPARNRIIAALSDATIVVEAATKGGALITADLANSYDREVFAVPGNWNQAYSTGANQLIKKHQAHILTQAKDLVEILNWDIDIDKIPDKLNNEVDLPLEPVELAVLEVLTQESKPMLLDMLSWHSQIAVNKLAGVLLNLELKGLVRSLPGKRYEWMK